MSNETIDSTSLSEMELSRTGAKLATAAIAFLAVAIVASILPGVSRVLPIPGGLVSGLVAALIAVALATALLALASRIAQSVILAVARPRSLATDAGSIAYWATVLTAVLVLHRGFAGLAATLLDGWVILYDVAFLAIALPPFLIVVLRLFFCIDPVAERLVHAVERHT